MLKRHGRWRGPATVCAGNAARETRQAKRKGGHKKKKSGPSPATIDTIDKVAPASESGRGKTYSRRIHMSQVVYVSKSRIERKAGPLRVAHLPGEAQPVMYSVHGAIAEHYKVDPAKLKESHSSTIDYVISATAG